MISDRPGLAPQNNNHNNGVGDYNATSIQVLGGREAVRRRPGMYIGSTDQRGLHHLVYEIVYNSVDEAMAGCCNRIKVTINEDNSVTVEDNGRGIPVEIHPTTGKSALETVMTVLHAGAKFGGKTYQVSGGLHGVGASVVNALSAGLKVTVKRDGKLYYQEYERGIPDRPVSRSSARPKAPARPRPSWPTRRFSATLNYDFDILSERLREIAYLNKGLEIYLPTTSERPRADLLLRGRHHQLRPPSEPEPRGDSPTAHLHLKKSNSTIVEAALQYNDGFAESIFSFRQLRQYCRRRHPSDRLPLGADPRAQ